MDRCAKVVLLADRPGGVPAGLRTPLRAGRFQVSTVGFDPGLQLVGSDPWNSSSYTGLIVPTTPTAGSFPASQSRYLFMLARAQFNTSERVRLVGMRMYASLFGTTVSEGTGPILEKQIVNPMWRLPDGNISWHVMIQTKGWRDRRNPLNADSLMYLDAYSPALLYQALAPYVPPNGGRPWGVPLSSDLGNIHDLRYPWRDSQVEYELDIPIPAPCDIVASASVFQNSTATPKPSLSANQFTAAGPEDQFWVAYNKVQFGRLAVSLIFEEEAYK
jgi:hypothetical protein